MGCKMIKGNCLALLILIFILTLVPVSCDNNSSISSAQSNPVGNVTSLYPPSSGNISEAAKTNPDRDFGGLEISNNILAIIASILTIAYLIIFEIIPRIRKRNIVLPDEKINPKIDPEKAPADPKPEDLILNGIIKLPHPPNPNFTGRHEFLSALARSAAQAVSRPKIFALVGNGGMGKTQIALQHAHNPENDFKYVWWLRSEEPATLLEDYISIARDLSLPGWNLRDTDQTVKNVKIWLEAERESRWLLVFDNAKKPEDLERYIPVAGSGQVIITSRQSVWDGLAETLVVKVFQREKMEGESVDFLLKKTGKSDRKGAADLASELGDLPLALEQAGAYIKESGISFSDYAARLKKLRGQDRKELLSQGKPQNYPDSVATTWEISFQAVRGAIPAAGDLLSLFAFLAPDAIPRSLLEGGAKNLPKRLANCVRNPGDLDRCIAVLKKYSLISAADNLISIHRLVQAVVQDRLSREDEKLWAESALKIISDAFSFDQLNMKTWEICTKLSSHAFYVSEYAQASPEEAVILLNNLGIYMGTRGELFSAQSVFEKMLVIDERAFGPDRPRIAKILSNLGTVLIAQRNIEGSKRCCERALAIGEKGLGLDHQTISSIFNIYGSVLMHQGNLEEAKRSHEMALAIDEKALGKDHPSVALDLNNLGLVLNDQGNHEEAKKCYERALAIDEKALGKDHPRVATIIHNIGLVLNDQGNHEEAKKCYERALAIVEKALGKDNLFVATIANNLGSVLRDQGDMEGAKKCFERALKIGEKALGPEHTNVAIRVSNLGSVLQDQGDLVGAKRCFERALAILEKRLGKDHPNSVLVRNNLKTLQE